MSASLDLSLFPPNTGLDGDGRLLIGGCALSELAEEFGTPALIIDEAGLRSRAREYVQAFTSRHANVEIHFAAKSFPSVAVLRVLAEEGLHADVASGNELAIALRAGFDPERLLLHGNAKSDAEIAAALAAGTGHVVIDNLDDVERLSRLAPASGGRVQPVLIRVTPGIQASTYDATATGHLGSKFGIEPADLPDVIEPVRAVPSLRLDGLHAHIGSQVFDLDQLSAAAGILAGFERFDTYDVGGGLAERYVSADPAVSLDAYAEAVVGAVHEHLGADVRLMVEPGRSIVARSAVSLYSVVTVKRAERTHVAVDGGMGDNLDVSLYGQPFQPSLVDVDPADRGVETADVVGHHCESGDVLVRDAQLPRARVGDLLVLPVTGAYTYTMSNNYNAATRPPVIFVRDGQAREVIRRETLDDLLRRELTL